MSLIVLAGCGLFVAACILIPQWFINKRIQPTLPPPGDATQFDPIQSLSAVQAYAGSDVRLVSFEAKFVRADGTLDLTATYKPSPTASYIFTKMVPPPTDTPPVGTRDGQASSTWQQRVTVKLSQPGQRFFVNRQSGGLKTSYNYVNKGMEKSDGTPQLMRTEPEVRAPRCTLRELWQRAIQLGVPQDGVATISYDKEGYRFVPYGGGKALNFGLDCKVVQ